MKRRFALYPETLCTTVFLLSVMMAGATIGQADTLKLDQWHYIQVDDSRARWGDWNEPRFLRSFGLAAADINGDDHAEILAGRYIYLNPTGTMTGSWERVDFGLNVDGMLITDVDGDEYGDVIATALPDVYWIEATDILGKSWNATRIARIPPSSHVNGQGYALGQVISGGKPEILLVGGDSVYMIEIPEKLDVKDWKTVRIAHPTMDEGFALADFDRDGDLDLAAGIKEGPNYSVRWFSNPGDGSGDWPSKLVTTKVNVPDRIVAADLNGDGWADIAVSEERYPGKEPDANLTWFDGSNPDKADWPSHHLIETWSLNNLDAGDLDQDGDVDLVTCEHKGPNEKLMLFENDGSGNFALHILDEGKESHLGSRLFDLDGDGDLDIVSVPWDDYQLLHVWRNDAITEPQPAEWEHVANHFRELPYASVGPQSAAVVADFDNDGTDDFAIAGWGDPRMVWFRGSGKKRTRYVVDSERSHIEAGGVAQDIDGDGDLDILQGGSWASNEVWWWENPYPQFDQDVAWTRHTIKDWGKKQHHDQIFGDFDDDGKEELVLWNQHDRKLLIADIPENPRKHGNWDFGVIWEWPKTFKYEGFAKGDLNGDDRMDLIGGGMWFDYKGDGTFDAHLVDAGYGMSRSAVGDFIEGGWLEVILGSGDGVGPLALYQWDGAAWEKTVLIEVVNHGHTLKVADINGDGHLDIYTAEMANPGAGDMARQWILYGDSAGHFTKQVLSTGIGTHEGQLGDLDGDGDIDVLQKDFMNERRYDLWLQK